MTTTTPIPRHSGAAQRPTGLIHRGETRSRWPPRPVARAAEPDQGAGAGQETVPSSQARSYGEPGQQDLGFPARPALEAYELTDDASSVLRALHARVGRHARGRSNRSAGNRGPRPLDFSAAAINRVRGGCGEEAAARTIRSPLAQGECPRSAKPSASMRRSERRADFSRRRPQRGAASASGNRRLGPCPSSRRGQISRARSHAPCSCQGHGAGWRIETGARREGGGTAAAVAADAAPVSSRLTSSSWAGRSGYPDALRRPSVVPGTSASSLSIREGRIQEQARIVVVHPACAG